MQAPQDAARLIRFGVFEVDLEAGELRKQGVKIKLQEQPFQVLTILLEKPGHVVTREELQKRLWSDDTFVDFETGLNTAIKKIREALGDSADNPRFVETLHRRGYRFIAPVDVGAGLAPPSGAQQASPLHKRRVAMATAVAVVAIAAILFAFNVAGLRDRLLRRGAPLPKIESIAVLPLENLSHDPEQEYFADAMTETLITNLGKIRALRVISRTTAMHFKGTKKTLPEIARELNVDAVVEGSVLRSGNRVRVTANLLHAPTDRHLWANSYESEMQDVLVLQGEVARAIAEEVRIKLTPEEHARLTTGRPINPEAYEAYLKGSYALRRVGSRPVTGIEYFRQAIAKDPSYSQAYVGLCLAYIQMGFGHGPLPPSQALAQTRQAALEALKRDDTLGEAHSCLAWVKAFGESDWLGGESGFRRGVELSPNSGDAHRLYSWYLSAMGRHEEAIKESRLALKLDPVSLASAYTVAVGYWWAQRYEQSAAELEKLEQMDPTYPGARHIRGLIYLQTGSYDQAIRTYQRAIALAAEDRPGWYVGMLGCAYARAGKRADAFKILNELQYKARDRYVSPYLVALVHANLGNNDRAFQWLEKAHAERNPILAFLKVDGVIDPLRSDPRFRDLLRRMNFPQ